MNGHASFISRTLARIAATGVLVCLAGCATSSRGPSAPNAPGRSALTPEAEKRAEAIAHYATGLIHQDEGRTEEALAEFEKAVAADPASEELVTTVARLYLTQKAHKKAVALLEKATSRPPPNAHLLNLLGYAYMADNDNAKAVVAFRRVVKLDPTDISAYQSAVRLYISQNQRDEALKLLNEAFKQKSTDPRFWSGLGDMFGATVYEEPRPAPAEKGAEEKATEDKEAAPTRSPFSGKTNPFIGFARALECYERAAKLAPDDDRILVRLADFYLVNKAYDKAVETYLKMLGQRPNSVALREKLALSYVAQDDKKKAVEQIEEILKKEPLKFKYYLMLGELYLDLSRGEKEEKAEDGKETERQRLQSKALDKFQQAVVLNPNEIEPHINIAYIQLMMKKPDEAIATLDKAKEKFPTSARLHFFYGLAYSDLKKYEPAIQAFHDAETFAQDKSEEILDSAFYFYYGAACERGGQIERAAEQFRKSIEMNPNNAEAYNYLGYMWAEKGIRLVEALDHIQKALEFEPDNGAYVDSLGWVYFKLGRYEEALNELLRAATLIKEPDPVVYDHIAEACMQLGKRQEAIQHWRKAVELDPSNREFADKLKRAESQP